jgi:hypothetical protein
MCKGAIMIYFNTLHRFSNPEPGTPREWASIAFINGLADIIFSIGFAFLVGFLLQGRSGEPVFGSAFTAMAIAIALCFGGALGIARWIGAWKIMRRSQNT